MLKETHEPFASAFWLGGTLMLDVAAVALHAPLPVHPGVVLPGTLIAAAFGAGKNSPDIDRMWAPGPPSHHYHWTGHRGVTHRIWFASVLTAVTTAVALVFSLITHGFVPWPVLALWYAPVTGWWSHLAGDMIFGRLKVLGRARGLGLRTGGVLESGGRWVRDPAGKISTAVCCVFYVSWLGMVLYVV